MAELTKERRAVLRSIATAELGKTSAVSSFLTHEVLALLGHVDELEAEVARLEGVAERADKMRGEALTQLGLMQEERDAAEAHIAGISRISDSEMMSLLRRRAALVDSAEATARTLAALLQADLGTMDYSRVRLLERGERTRELDTAIEEVEKALALPAVAALLPEKEDG